MERDYKVLKSAFCSCSALIWWLTKLTLIPDPVDPELCYCFYVHLHLCEHSNTNTYFRDRRGEGEIPWRLLVLIILL